jgi:hypothetical protein
MSITPEDRKRYNRKWKENNPEAAKESHRRAQKKWRDKNRQRVRDRTNEWARRNRDKMNAYARKQHLKYKYGLCPESKAKLLEAQGGCCKVCKVTQPGNKGGWVVDHCHSSNAVRGILCHHCNLALGNAKDSVERLKALITYLEEAECP